MKDDSCIKYFPFKNIRLVDEDGPYLFKSHHGWVCGLFLCANYFNHKFFDKVAGRKEVFEASFHPAELLIYFARRFAD